MSSSMFDVAIIGYGPAGATLANQLGQLGLSVLVLEKDADIYALPRAIHFDGEVMRVFETAGLRTPMEAISRPGHKGMYFNNAEGETLLIRAGTSAHGPHGCANNYYFHQPELEQVLREGVKRYPQVVVRTQHEVMAIEEVDAHVAMQVRDITTQSKYTVHAKYVVGCDGAHSKVRKSIGGELHGDAAHQAWGVMDILANTDFPDVRQKCLISSANEGNVLILPREGGYVFRMYVELDKLNVGEKAAQRKLTQHDMIAAANRIIKPYTIDVKEVVWWSIYDIGHSITDKFDDIGENGTGNPRVFTAGDACHTHSPKAGQGMNVSMQDTFNLGWKLVHVLQGRSDPSLLRSYSKERLTEAKRLVETDHEWARIMSAPTTQAERDGTEEPRIIRQFKANLEFTGGTAVKYDHSYLFAASAYQALAKGEEIGRRFHSAPVVRVSDAKQMQLGHAAEADARWRIYAFAGAGDLGQPDAPMAQLADWLEKHPDSPVVKHTRTGEDIDAIIDVRAVFQPTFDQLAYEKMPSLLKPHTGKLGLQDHEKIFCVDHKGLGDIYDMRGIDRQQGCMIVVRPDQYVAHVLPLNATAELSTFFTGVLR